MFHGSIVALVTPMQKNGDIDFECLRSLVEMHIDSKTDAIVACGSTGEGTTLNVQERLALFKHVKQQAAGRIPVIAGTGLNSTRDTIALTQEAMRVGVDACLIVTPAYNKPTQEGLYLHYKAIAESVAVPILLYNVPGRTACDMLPETVERLAGISNIVGLKESTSKVERIQELVKRCGDRLDIISGEDAHTFEFIPHGAKGVISISANIVPKLSHDMCQAALSGDMTTAKSLDQKMQPLYKQLFVESNPIPIKWAMYEVGMIPEGIRLPLTPLSEKFHNAMRDALRQVGVTEHVA